jgi:DNA-binding transcriptional ArsR family regulator
MNRDEMVIHIKEVSETSGSKLDKLLDKADELLEKGNKYGVKFTERQFDLAVDPVVKAEYMRSRILELTRETPLSVKEISEKLALASKEVLRHISVLRRRNLMVADRVDDRVPKYRGLIEEPSKQNGKTE